MGLATLGNAYNFISFDAAAIPRQVAGPRVGERAPDVLALGLRGKPQRLSALLLQGPVVLEFGSATCPFFLHNAPAMEELAREFGPPRSVFQFRVVYTREGHPGERLGPHGSLDEKLARARALQRELHLDRPVWVDGLDGEAHLAFGGFPDMVYVIDREGRVAYRALWNDPGRLRRALDQLFAHEISPEELPRAPAYSEDLALAPPRLKPAFMRRCLERAGMRAVHDVERASGRSLASPLGMLLARRMRER